MIFELYIWIISFLSLYVSVFWIIISSHNINKKLREFKEWPTVSIAVPAWNEEKTIIKTIESLTSLDYDKDKLEILIINDGSKDNTQKIVKEFLDSSNLNYVKLINQKNTGKAGALNTALKIANGEYFGVFDADSLANPKALKLMLPYFTSDKVGAVISPIKVSDAKNVIEKIQRIEYIFSSFVRKLMSRVGTLHVTHGVLSLFRKDVIQKLGGFDDVKNKNLTEDYEIAMRLRKNHYDILLCEENMNYTKVPDKVKGLWLQRVRWFRGFMVNGLEYKSMIMSKRHGLLGRFQIPLELLTMIIVLFSFGFISYNFFRELYKIAVKVYIVRWELLNFSIPSIKEIILTINFKIVFPFIVTLIAGLYLYNLAHKYANEKWQFHLVSFIYLFLYPFLRSLQWVHAFFLTVFGAKERWR